MTATSTGRQLSRRVQRLRPSATFAVSGRVKALQREGKDVIGFGAGEPDFDTPDVIKDAAIASLRAGNTRYQPVPGPPEVREAIAAKLRDENGVACTADDIVVSVGAKHSLYLALQALVDEGDDVVVPTPAWVSYRAMVELAGGTVIEVPGPTERDFKITPKQLADAITPRTSVVMLSSPSNPCGTMYSPDELAGLARVLVPHERVTVISDEIYEKLVFTDVPHCSFASLPGMSGRVVTINGMSKAFAMTGWRLGYLAAPDSATAKAIAKLQGQMTSHPTSFALPAIPAALARASDDVERMRKTFAARGRLMHDLISAMPGVTCPRPTGAFYVFPDVSAHFGRRTSAGRILDGAVGFAEALLEEALVGVVPGDDFGACARDHVRLSFACAEEQIEAGCRRMHAWLETLEAT